MHAASMIRPCAFLVAAGMLACGSSSARAVEPSSAAPKIENVDFERHVMAIFGKSGCAAGACHGSFQGKGGFRLSLFGYDAEADYFAISRDNQGRRANPTNPDASLVLLKATGATEHGGTRRFAKESWQYQLMRQWIVEGMKWNKGSGTVEKITITPPEYAFKKAGDNGVLKVVARFTDGVEEDITHLCDYRTNDEAVVNVSPRGELESKRPGDTSLVVSYRGNIMAVRVMVPATLPPGFKYPQVAEVNYIDREVFAKLKRLNVAPSGLADDEEFLRRITIDTTGSLPTVEEVRTFVASKDPKKREKKIDELLKSPRHAALWATKLSDITGNNTDQMENPQNLKPKLSQMWHDWIRKRVQDNVTYDKIVHDILCATSRDGDSPEDFVKKQIGMAEEMGKGFTSTYAERKSLDLFWRRQQRPQLEVWGEKTAVAFLGVRVECAQCHKHPFDRWTQDDYWAYANVFASVTHAVSPESKKAIDEANVELRKGGKNPNQVPQIREVYSLPRPQGMKANPTTLRIPQPKALGGPSIDITKGDPREALFAWMKQAENPFFARSFVNRVWGHYFGVGIVHPVDDFSLANPPTNAKLLDALTKDFVDGGYDIRKLEKTILLSRTYQLGSAANETNKYDTNCFSRSYVRPLMAEVVVDVINDAMGTTESFGTDAPPGARAIEVGSTRLQQGVNATVREAFRVFGRSTRASTCDCDRQSEPTVAHKLFLIADQGLTQKITAANGRLRKLIADKKTTEEMVEELFLGTLSRYPSAEEKKGAVDYANKKTDRQEGLADILWALVNTKEFIFNH